MNRIYQGKVSQAELLDAKGNAIEPQPQDWDGESALWDHHALFQDAVNHNTLALAAMAVGVAGNGERESAVQAWAKEVRDSWMTARRKAVVFDGPHQRVAPLLGLDPVASDFDACAARILAGSKATKEQMAAALLQLLEEANASDLSQLANDRLGWFCSPKGKNDKTSKSIVAVQETKMIAAIKAVHGASDTELETVASSFEPGYFVTQFPKERMTGVESRAEAERQFDMAAKKHTALMGLRERFCVRLAEIADGLSLARLGRRSKGAYPLAVVFKLFPIAPVAAVFREATATMAKRRPSAAGADRIAEARVDDTPVFEYFTNRVLNRDVNNDNAAVWGEFDHAAFVEAIKSPHRYFQDTQKREKAADELRTKLVAMEGEGGKLDDENDEDEREGRAIGFAGDSRITLITKLVFSTHYVGEEGDHHSEVALRPFIRDVLTQAGIKVEPNRPEYTIQERTLRGWGEVRKKWRTLAAKGPVTEQQLLAAQAEEQGKHRDDYGSASLYTALAKPEFHPVWMEPGADKPKWHADDPLRAWCAYRELRFELADKTRPIRFTPAHPVESPRYFIIPKAGRFGTEHLPGRLALTCGIVWRTEHGLEPCAVRLTYSAPRLCRDELRSDGDANLAAVNWLQPMMKALGIPNSDMQDFSNCRVTLQPSGPKNIQLTFPVEMEVGKLQAALKHKERWSYQASGKAGQMNFAQFNYSAEEPRYEVSLRWPSDIQHSKDAGQPRKREPEPWHQKFDSFTCLATDLGQRDAGAFALLDVKANSDFNGKPFRFIGETPGKQWRARLAASGIFRLPGEDRKEWRAPTRAEEQRGESGFAFRPELWGERGRAATPHETEDCARLLAAFACAEVDLMPDDWRTSLSFPERNDKLLRAAGRAQSRAARLHRWCWFLTDEKLKGRVEGMLKEIAELEDECLLPDTTKKLATAEKTKELVVALSGELRSLRDKLPGLLVRVANRCAPLRGRSWHWGAHPRKPDDCFLLSQEGSACPNAKQRRPDATERDVTWIRGQRGLSFERIEQIESLRQRFQSLNQVMRRDIGSPPKKRRDDAIPDPCPDLLDKLDALKEQRVNQTAHMILAEALGVRLASPPADKARLRAECDQHGVYVRIRPPVDFIVIEDLSRYRASQGRAPRENSRLMKWCHGQVRGKLKQLCEVFGLPVVEAPAAWSSRFCARSGVPGFRAVEVHPAMKDSAPWRWHLERLAKYEHDAKANPLKPKALRECRAVHELFRQLDELNASVDRTALRPKWRTLLAPVAGGPIFVPLYDRALLASGETLQPAVVQADINAAINLALRAIADPRLWSIHPRLRTARTEAEAKSGVKKGARNKVAVTEPAPDGTLLFFTREKRKFGEKQQRLTVPSPSKELRETTGSPNFFAFLADRRREAGEAFLPEGDVRLLSGSKLWGTVKALQWWRCTMLNKRRGKHQL
ncbi:MAG TPA: type V CRISPR-associated protein Cas12b [Verrucomicrobiae bacterium]|nr:type V CRISPR-associated protein Cas12b [Verrucomicrobiae bacterium]